MLGICCGRAAASWDALAPSSAPMLPSASRGLCCVAPEGGSPDWEALGEREPEATVSPEGRPGLGVRISGPDTGVVLALSLLLGGRSPSASGVFRLAGRNDAPWLPLYEVRCSKARGWECTRSPTTQGQQDLTSTQ